MARHTAIAAVSETLRQLLDEERQAVGLSGSIELFDTASFTPNIPLSDGLSIYLYRIKQSQMQRNRILPPTTNGTVHVPPLPLDLHYLLTAWNTNSVVTQHQLLGWGMRTLANYSELTANVLNHYSPGEDDTFRPNEKLQLIYDYLSLDDMNTVTEGLRINVSAAYVVRILYLETSIEQTEAPDVQTRILDLGVKDVDA